MAKKNKIDKITNWKGYKNYECRHCKFATLNQREMAQHIDVHIRSGIAEAEQEANAPVVDENYGLDVGVQTKAEAKQAAKEAKAAEKEAAKQADKSDKEKS